MFFTSASACFQVHIFRHTRKTSTSSKVSSSMLVGSLGKTITFCTVPRSRSEINKVQEPHYSKNIYIYLHQPGLCHQLCRRLTCPQKEHLVAPIHSIHLIHHQGSEAIVHAGSHHQGATMDRINWMEHEGMGPDEIHGLI